MLGVGEVRWGNLSFLYVCNWCEQPDMGAGGEMIQRLSLTYMMYSLEKKFQAGLKKLTVEEKILPTTPARYQTHNLLHRSPTLYQLSYPNPGRSSRTIFYPRVDFLCWLFFSVHSTPVLMQWHPKNPWPFYPK